MIFDLLVTLAATFIVLMSCVMSWVSGDGFISIGFALLAAWFLDVMFLGWKVIFIQVKRYW